MEHFFWHQRWEKNEISFHEGKANANLVRYFTELALAPGARLFLPLCGKTRDITWLLSHGYRVAGAELSEIAIGQLFAELGREPTIEPVGRMKRYHAADIDIFVGDLFDLAAEQLGPVDAIYDRAALVALPEVMRQRYARHLVDITRSAPQLLITFEYDQSQQEGPPFSVNAAELQRHYANHYQLRLLASLEVAGGLKGRCAATECVWLLGRR